MHQMKLHVERLIIYWVCLPDAASRAFFCAWSALAAASNGSCRTFHARHDVHHLVTASTGSTWQCQRLSSNTPPNTALVQVFEHMEMNLRELSRKVGVGRGIKIDAVAQLTLQMLIALRHLRACKVLHADIKPDNILINSRMNKIKLCDLGSALFSGRGTEGNTITPYLVSRFYRAPEVMLGLQYGAQPEQMTACVDAVVPAILA
jgi:serine/threonine protein kinase